MSYTPTIALDFDGVIHDYHGWNDGKLGRPIDNSFAGVQSLLGRGLKVIIFTTRDKESVRGWLATWNFPDLEVTNEKPPWLVLLDDRAVCFEGTWSAELVEQLVNFRPHWDDGKGNL
jgi:hypothetical protein